MELVQLELKKDGTAEILLRGTEKTDRIEEALCYAADCAARTQGVWLAGRAFCKAVQEEDSAAFLVQAAVLPPVQLPAYLGLQAEGPNRRVAEQRLLKGLCAASRLEVPELALDLEVGYQFRQLERRLQKSGITMEQHVKRLRKTEAELWQDLARYAQSQLHDRFALLAIACDEGLDVTEQELSAAAQRAVQTHRLRSVDRMQLRQYLCVQKASAYVLRNTEFRCTAP